MHAETKSVFPLEIQNDMLHFFLIKVVKRKRRTLEEKLEIMKLNEQGLSNVQFLYTG